MNIFLLSVLLVGAFARPDVSELGYHYQGPATSYQAPSGSVGDLSQRQYYHVNDRTYHAPTSQYQAPIYSSQNFRSSGAASDSTGTAQTSTFGVSQESSFSGGQSSRTDISQQTSFGGSQSGSSSSGTTFTSDSIHTTAQQAELRKHLYFYTAPFEQEVVRPRINFAQSAGKKDVKLIFIKAPSQSLGGPITIPAPAQNEEKTVVYVLVKKQDQAPEINIEASQASKPTKPEVYFIKYQSQREAQEAIANAQNGIIPQGVANANSVNGDSEFINTISQESARSSASAGAVSGAATGPDTISSNTVISSPGPVSTGSVNVGVHSAGAYLAPTVVPSAVPVPHALYGVPN